MRYRLAKITDYKKDFDKVFDGFIENTLPRDDLYRDIEKSMEKRKTKATAEAKEILEGEPVLPEPELSNVEKQSKRYN